MSDSNKDTGGGGEGGPPADQLTREEVMAQRAEKKKLKEARKNKNAGGGKGQGEDKVKGDPSQQPQKAQKKPPLQQKQQQSSDTSKGQQQQQGSEPSKGQQQPQKQSQKQKQPPVSKTPQASNQAASKEKTIIAKAATPQPKVKETPPKATVEAVKEGIPTKDKTGVLTVEEVKLGAPDRPLLSAAKTTDFQSTIQSLFKVKGGEANKDINFQLHPIFHNLGVKLRNDVIRGTNHRCIALLLSLKDYVQIFETPSGMTFKHAFSDDLKKNMNALRKMCPFAIGMNNAVEFLNAHLYKIEQDNNDTRQLKEEVLDVIDQYIEEKIEKAVEAIVFYGVEKVMSGDVLMIYSLTEAVLHLLEKAAEDGKTFELIVLHTPQTMLDIPVLLKKLREPISKQAVRISTVNFSNAIYRMRHCTKLIIGGHGLFTTGGVMAQSGSGKLALLASTFNKPAIFLCETYKFCDRSPLDFFTLDEYMPELSMTDDDLFEPKIKYDVTPAHLVTVVITDIDMLPSISVPVVLRVQEGRVQKVDD